MILNLNLKLKKTAPSHLIIKLPCQSTISLTQPFGNYSGDRKEYYFRIRG